MDTGLRKAQLEILKVFAKTHGSFALSGGTALELYYLKHRFSADLDFFSKHYPAAEIGIITAQIAKVFGVKVKLESEFSAAGRAGIRFYSVFLRGLQRPLKIDFVQDVLARDPVIKKMKGVPVYSVNEIYLQKITAISGSELKSDDIGRQIGCGRNEPRDAFDVYMLSKKICPLSEILLKVNPYAQLGLVHWYRNFSRQDLLLGVRELEIYNKRFDPRQMLIHLESEIKTFIRKIAL